MMRVMFFDRLMWLSVAASFALAGCGETPRILGKSLPDETKVIDGPSLALPPSFDLRPPRDAKDYEVVLQEETQTHVQALMTGVSGTAAPAAPAGPGDAWLVQQAGGAQANPAIREQLDRDQETPEAKPAKGLFGRWFGASDE